MKTFTAKSETCNRKWVVVDAKGQTLGRLASQVASILRGKNKPDFTPHMDTGDFVIVLNAKDIQVTGKKLKQKMYRRHSGYPGGFKEIALKDLLAKSPEKVIEKAVWGMIPHNRLGRQQIRKLKVYAGDIHPHKAQKPEEAQLISSQPQAANQ